MLKFESKPWLRPSIVLVSLVILGVDYFLPRGSAEYIFYFIPVLLTIFQPSPMLPFTVMFITSVLSLIGYILSPESGADPTMAITNRTFSIVTMGMVALLVRQNISARNSMLSSDWLKGNLAKLILSIRGELTAKEIGKLVLTNFVETTGAKVGNVYLQEERSNRYSLLETHASDPATTPKYLEPGHGIAGEVLRSGKMEMISSLPEDYLPLKSTSGAGKPASIVVIPLAAENSIIGCLELAFTNEVPTIVTQLLEQSSESIAVYLNGAQRRDQVARLLHESQQMTEELQTQQEELKVSNEELEQQSRALKESHVRLETQQSELEQTNQQLEEQAQALENQKTLLDERNRDLEAAKSGLEEKARDLARASGYKSEFLANMSHELRTPLNSTLILAKLLSENKPGNLNEEQIRYAEIIHTAGTDLLSLINDILDLSKVEAGKMTLVPELLRFEQLERSLDHAFTAVAMDRKLTFKIERSPDLPQEMVTDRQRLEQILKNFLSNAFKFTQSGSVTLKVSPHPMGVAFAVVDTGIGIAPQEKEAVFEAFRQADGTTNRKFGGTGLGLSISKELAKLLGGKIELESEKGKGSTFTLILPLKMVLNQDSPNTFEQKKAPESKVSQSVPANPGISLSFKDDREHLNQFRRKMLIIEDDEIFAKVLLDAAHDMKFGALVATTADEGLRLAKTHLPQAIVLDVRLPDHSGLVVLDQLKQYPQTRHIPIHVISSEDFSRGARELGAMGYMIKPVKREELEVAFQNLTSVMEQEKKRVLLVEDDEIQRKHVEGLIASGTVTVDAVESSQKALDHLSRHTYDCMIMDLSLPDMSGHELLAKIAAEHSLYSFPPVIVYTARDLTREEEERLRLYSGSIIIKGARSPERLLSEVTLFLHKIETELPPEKQKMLRDLRNREKNLEERSILVVDDDVRNIFALTAALENAGCKVSVARNGIEALKKLSESSQTDLVLMDIMMPEMDGYETLRRMRADPKLRDIPAIALTAKAMADDRQKCLDAGASDYLAKPIDTDKLMSLIRVWLPPKRSFRP